MGFFTKLFSKNKNKSEINFEIENSPLIYNNENLDYAREKIEEFGANYGATNILSPI